MRFTWDENKNKANIKKHGIAFDYAVNVFDDEFYLELYDEYHDEAEERYQVIGMVDDILTVVVTYRNNDEVRIISARKATKKERMMYYDDRF